MTVAAFPCHTPSLQTGHAAGARHLAKATTVDVSLQPDHAPRLRTCASTPVRPQAPLDWGPYIWLGLVDLPYPWS